MKLFDYLFQAHEIYLFALLALLAILLSVISVTVVQRYIPLKLRYQENPVIGNMSALISIIYGVLAGLMALYLINNVNASSDAVQREANAVANIYRESKWLKQPVASHLRDEIKNYLENVINVEWPHMRQGETVDHAGDQYVDRISDELIKYVRVNTNEMVMVRGMLDELRSLHNAREDRIAASTSGLSREIWIVILLGTVLTILINYLFGMHLFLHMITASAATLMAFSMIFLLLTLDRPFQGEFVIEADVFKPLLAQIEAEK